MLEKGVKSMNLKNVKGTIVCPFPSDDAVDMRMIDKLTRFTANDTWEKNRNDDEKKRNTIQGKKAEYVVEELLRENTSVRYLSYDAFRTDNFEKHAPFDGLLFVGPSSGKNKQVAIDNINREITLGDKFGKISPKLREQLRNYGIFTLEIKSSKLREKDYENVENKRFRTDEDYSTIATNIKRWDFFVYPHYSRNSQEIKNFYEYSEYVWTLPGYKKYDDGKKHNFQKLNQLIMTEYRNASDIYTRVYVDTFTDELYIPGYVIKENFYKNPKIAHMPGTKSGRALYYMYPIDKGYPFLDLQYDNRLLEYDFQKGKEHIFAGKVFNCPYCGDEIAICSNSKMEKYYYRCFSCQRNFDIDEIVPE